jgi:TM2 domain-containing membrane protein YozV
MTILILTAIGVFIFFCLFLWVFYHLGYTNGFNDALGKWQSLISKRTECELPEPPPFTKGDVE